MKKERRKVIIENIKNDSSKELLLESEQYDPENYKPLNIAEVFKGRAKKYNSYQETNNTKGLRCINCVRWRFSYPYTCGDYDIWGSNERDYNKAETCLNYNEDSKCEVD